MVVADPERAQAQERAVHGGEPCAPQVPPEDICWDEPVLRCLTQLQDGQRVVQAADALARLRTEGPWFQGSLATDGLGLPMALYHGTSVDFEQFADNDRGIWMAEDPEQAALFSGIRSGAARVLKLHASIRRPWITVRYGSDFPYSRMLDQAIPALKALGYDGIYRPQDRVWVAFEPHQVRSAFAPEYGEGEGQPATEEAQASPFTAGQRQRG